MAEVGDERMVRIFQQKARIFLENGTIAHVKTKTGQNINGKVNWVGADFFFMSDYKLNESVPVFYLEIKDLQPSVVKLKKEGENGGT